MPALYSPAPRGQAGGLSGPQTNCLSALPAASVCAVSSPSRARDASLNFKFQLQCSSVLLAPCTSQHTLELRVCFCACVCVQPPLILQAPHGQILCFIHLRIRNAQCLTFSDAQITSGREGRRGTWLPGSSTPGRCQGMPSPPQPFPMLKRGLPPGFGFPGGSGGEESACNLGDLSWIPGLGRPPGGGHGNPLQYSCLENPRGQRSLGGCSPWGHKLPPKYTPVLDGCFS